MKLKKLARRLRPKLPSLPKRGHVEPLPVVVPDEAPIAVEGLGGYMTEAEFDRRLQTLLRANMDGDAMGDLEGFADLFSGIKNVFMSAGSAIASGASKVASGLASGVSTLANSAGGIVSNLGAALTSPGGASLVSTAGQFLVAKKAAQIEQNKIALQTALVNQGYVPTSPAAQSLLGDVASQGVVAANGRVLFPGFSGTTSRGRGVMSGLLDNPMPVVIAGAGILALFLLTRRSGGRHG